MSAPSPQDRIDVSRLADDSRAHWSGSHESDLLLVAEAHRRFVEITRDPRQACVLAMAWASLVARLG